MVTDLVQIRTLAQAKETENLRFRRYLKRHPCPERIFHAAAEEAGKQIDCCRCANCCRQTTAGVTPADIEAIGRYLDLPAEEVFRQYTTTDPEDKRRVLRQADGACVFLDGNLCLVYEARPRVCREFPHLLTAGRSLGNRLASICRRAGICPIVYNALESLKAQVGFKP